MAESCSWLCLPSRKEVDLKTVVTLKVPFSLLFLQFRRTLFRVDLFLMLVEMFVRSVPEESDVTAMHPSHVCSLSEALRRFSMILLNLCTFRC